MENFTIRLSIDMLLRLFLTATILASLSDGQYQALPRRAFSHPGGNVTILGKYGSPLTNCEFWYFPGKRKVDLSDGHDSPSSDEYEYVGEGLDKGECGIMLKRLTEENDGIVESRVKSISKATWDESGTTLRVSVLPQSQLPQFEMIPNRADLIVGDNLNITCNAAGRPITMCHIYLPGGTFLDFNRGAKSAASRLARYLGRGLEVGDCGVQLTGVTTKLNGYLVCKVGDWPESTPGPWETDAMYITTREASAPPPFTVPPTSEPIETTSSSTPPRKDGKCPPILQPNLELLCTSGGATVPCDTPMNAGATVLMRCKRDIHVYNPSQEQKSITCTSKGVWSSSVLMCDLDCGNRNAAGRPFVSGGNVSKEGEFPWQIAIYKRDKPRSYSLICSGSLVSPNYILTAAHCFADSRTPGQNVNIRPYFMVAGKHRTAWLEGGERRQVRNITQLVIPQHYTGRVQNFALDIAIVKVNKPYALSWAVNVVCIDWRKITGARHTTGTIGIVPGWGLTENNQQSSELHSVEIPYISHDDCWERVTLDFQRFITTDKMCGGYQDRGVSVCPGDSGGGFAFPITTPRGTRYYLKGIVSVGPKLSNDKCEINQVAAFTAVESHTTWLYKVVKKEISLNV